MASACLKALDTLLQLHIVPSGLQDLWRDDAPPPNSMFAFLDVDQGSASVVAGEDCIKYNIPLDCFTSGIFLVIHFLEDIQIRLQNNLKPTRYKLFMLLVLLKIWP